MANDNVISDSMVAKIISVVVAIVVFAVVLVPIVDSVSDSGGTTEGEVLYTNTGDWYYSKATNDVQMTYSFSNSVVVDEYSNYIKINDGDYENMGDVEVSDNGWDSIDSFPIFTFKTADGKYGIEGVCALPTPTETVIASEQTQWEGTLCWYRAIQGDNDPTIVIMGDSSDVSINNGTVTYSFGTGNTFEPLNGTYELYLTGQTEGDYTRSSNATVLSDTEFYVNGCIGSVGTETNGETGNLEYVSSYDVLVNGKGTVATITDSVNVSILGITGYYDDLQYLSNPSPNLMTTPAESGEGIVLGAYTVSEEEYWSDAVIQSYIVPTEIRENTSDSGSGMTSTILSVIPIFVAVGLIIVIVGMFYDPKKQ